MPLGVALSPVSRASRLVRATGSRRGWRRQPWPARARAAGSGARRTAGPGDCGEGRGRRPERHSGRSGTRRSSARVRAGLSRVLIHRALGAGPRVWSMILSRSWRVPPLPGDPMVRNWLLVDRAPRRLERRWHLFWYCPALYASAGGRRVGCELTGGELSYSRGQCRESHHRLYHGGPVRCTDSWAAHRPSHRSWKGSLTWARPRTSARRLRRN